MNPQDVNNIVSLLQEILRLMQDTNSQLIAMRGETQQATDDLKGTTARIDQQNATMAGAIDTLSSQLDVIRGDMASVKSSVDSNTSTLDSRLNDVKSSLNDLRAAVR